MARMEAPPEKRWRTILPWVVSACLLAYVFGWATDWQKLQAATEQANLPLFVVYATLDRLAFFIIWTWLSAAALRRFVVHVPVRSVFAIRGGSELARAVSNPLSDAAFFMGIVRLAGGRIDAVLASALVPVVSHPGNRSVVTAAVIMWAVVAASTIGVWLSRSHAVSLPWIAQVRIWLDRFPPRQLVPFLAGFGLLALFDIQIQWLASRAFGIPIEWSALAARIPLVYLSFAIPTLGNFGTRELTWAALFGEFGPRDALIAYAFSINAIFLVLNVLIGVVFLQRALELIGDVRRARRAGREVPRPLIRDPTDQ
jgi:hypothetical protein